jgi:hypothetical protein
VLVHGWEDASMTLASRLVVIALMSVTWHSSPVQPRTIVGGTFEASAVAHVPHVPAVLFTDDGRADEIFWMELDEGGNQRGAATPIALGTTVVDMEGMTFDGDFHYVVGSQSKTTGVTGDGLVRFRFDPATRRVTGLERVAGLKQWLADHVTELHGTGAILGDEILNIEAVAWDPGPERLLLGLRAPVVDGHALVIPLKLKERTAPLSAANLVVDGESIRLPLDGDGIRSLEYIDGRFRLISGASLNAENRDFRIMEWYGATRRPGLKELGRVSRMLKPEGIAGGSTQAAQGLVVFDTGYFALLPW